MVLLDYIQSKNWQTYLEKEPFKSQLQSINKFLEQGAQNGNLIYPEKELVFEAFNRCSFENIKVIIIGQDPYHNLGQAHGLSFSVPKGVKIPPSLINIFKEIKSDIGIQNAQHGDLSHWAAQGVLLLNSILTVNENAPGSHRKSGWEEFTDELIRKLSNDKKHLVFILWGSFALSKATLLDANKHLILKSAHPSPLSAYRGFFGCQHFSKTNAYLKEHGKKEIDWITA